MASRELRLFPRATLTVDVRLETDFLIFTGVSSNVSRGGIFVSTAATLPIGAFVALQFSLPTEPPRSIFAHGRVRWQRSASEGAPPGLGIGFDALTLDDVQAFAVFCDTHSPPIRETEDT
jgi:uncharacterized protein (TIGR02266 family)